MSKVKKHCAETAQSLFNKYCTWLAKNPNLSKEVELGMKLCSYVLVNFLDKGDAAHQVVYCLTDLYVFLNDFAVSRAYRHPDLPYGNNLKTWLTIIEHCEVCFEVGAQQKWGTQGKWMVIAIIQVMKCICRIKLLRRNEGLVPYPPIVQLNREAVAEKILTSECRENPMYTLCTGVTIRRVETGGSPFNTAVHRPGDDYKSLRRNAAEYVFKGRAYTGEVLFAIKPLVHLAAIRYTGRNSWFQWLTSLAVEFTSLHYQWNDFASQQFKEEQKRQYMYRIFSVLLYLVRAPFYDVFVKSVIIRILNGFRRIFPFLKFALDPAIEFLPAWQNTYFYLWSH